MEIIDLIQHMINAKFVLPFIHVVRRIFETVQRPGKLLKITLYEIYCVKMAKNHREFTRDG